MLKITFEENSIISAWRCSICHNPFALKKIVAKAKLHGENIGYICNECLERDVDEIKEIFENHIVKFKKKLKEDIEWLQKAATIEEIERPDIEKYEDMLDDIR